MFLNVYFAFMRPNYGPQKKNAFTYITNWKRKGKNDVNHNTKLKHS